MTQKGILSYGAYIPYYRLQRKSIAAFYEIPALPGERTVAGYDEDVVSIGVEAARNCLRDKKQEVHQLIFATTSNPYKEKSSIPTIALALDLAEQVQGTEPAHSLRAGTSSLIQTLLDKQPSTSALVLCADSRIGGPSGQNEQLSGDGGAAFLIGDERDAIAQVVGALTLQHETIGQWRSEGDEFIQSWEERFQDKVITESIRQALQQFVKNHPFHLQDIQRVVLSVPGVKLHLSLGLGLGFQQEQIQDPHLLVIGNTGAAHAPMMLAAALDDAKPHEKILVINYAEGVDILLLETTENILTNRPSVSLKEQLHRKQDLPYRDYLKWKRLLPLESPRRPETRRPSVPALYRNYKQNIGFYGSKCTSCGTPQFPMQRICVVCQSKDKMEDYRFIGRKATVTTYTVDYLAASQAPPTIVGVIDFEGGGRVMCEITDCQAEDVAIGMEVKMSFRRLYEAGGIHNYFWKAKPAQVGEGGKVDGK